MASGPDYAGLRWAAYANRRPVAFGLAVVAAIMASRVLVFSLLFLFVEIQELGPGADELVELGTGRIMLMFALLPLETWLGQQLPIALLSRLGVTRPLGLVTLSALVFGALHGAAGFVSGATAGVMLSYAFLCWRVDSVGTAFWRTTAVHAASNSLALCLSLVSPY